MALVPAFVGYALFRLARQLLPKDNARRDRGLGHRGVPLGRDRVGRRSASFYLLGGEGSASAGTVLAAMVGVHTLIGIGEGIITALTVGAVLAVRPDLVYGARDLAARAASSHPVGVA